MGYEYKSHFILATGKTWLKIVRVLVSYFNVRLHFIEDFQLKPIPQGDLSSVSELIRFGNLSTTDLISLNIMPMHHQVIHKSDIILCNDKTIAAEMLTGSPCHSDSHKFQTQRPTPADLAI
jgi:hypothetical protein